MKRTLALVVLAALGFVAAGCASGKKAVVRSHAVRSVVGSNGVKILGVGTATLPNVKPGTRVSCEGAPALTVPYDTSSAAAVRGPDGRSFKLSRSLNGTVTVSCTR